MKAVLRGASAVEAALVGASVQVVPDVVDASDGCLLVMTDDPAQEPASGDEDDEAQLVIGICRDPARMASPAHPHFDAALPLAGFSSLVLEAVVKALVESRTSLREAQAARAERDAYAYLAALGEVTHGVGHELSNLLAILLAWSAQLRVAVEATGPERVRTMATRIDGAGQRILKIVNGLGLCARGVVAQAPGPFSLGEIVEQAVEICASRLRVRDVKMAVKLPERASIVSCQPGQLTQMMVGLIANAIEATEGSSDRWIEIGVVDHGKEVEIAISDSGPGVPDALKDRVFEAAFSTKDGGRRPGLGLTLARSIMARHAGTLRLDPTAAHTRFVAVLPR